MIGPIKIPIDVGQESTIRYRWYFQDGTDSGELMAGVSRVSPDLNFFNIDSTPPDFSEGVFMYDTNDHTNIVFFPFPLVTPVTPSGGITAPVTPGLVILTIPLNVGVTLGHVVYRWIANGVIGSELSDGITQPDTDYPVFRVTVAPPDGAEELILYDSTDHGNWQIGNYPEYLFSTQASISDDLASLRTRVATYFNRDEADLTVNGVDLFLQSANDMRKNAEKRHNFELARCVAEVTITNNVPVSLKDATIIESEGYVVELREIVSVARKRKNGTFIPLDFTRSDIASERTRSAKDTRNYNYDSHDHAHRYLSDRDHQHSHKDRTVIQRGNKILFYPEFDTTVTPPIDIILRIEGYGWMRQYGAGGVQTGPEDFFVEHAIDWLKYAIICDLNSYLKVFVPRQEGSLPMPYKERDEAWRDLLIWDTYQVDSHISRTQ